MKHKLMTGGATLFLAAALAFGQGATPQRPAQAQPAAAAQQRPAAAPAAQRAATTPDAGRALVDQYCITCHSDRLKKANLSLEKLDMTKVGENAEVWEKVVRKLRAGMMPPIDLKRPDQQTTDAFLAWLENELDKSAALRPSYSPPGAHRLNRAEYANAVKDILGLDVDPASFLPVDDSIYGFDNVAGSLGMSSALLEGYISAAAKISRIALGHDLAPAEKKWVAPQDYSQEGHVDGLPFGTRGGMLVKYYFPADGEYAISFEPVRGNTGELYGGNRKGEQLEVLVDGVRVGLFNFDDSVFQQGTDNEKHEILVPVKAGMRTIGVAFLASTQVPIDDLNQHYLRSVLDTNPVPGYVFSPQIARVIVRGPYNGAVPAESVSRSKILTCRPTGAKDEPACAKQIISELTKRAYRRPSNDEDLETLMSFYEEGRKSGDFEAGIELAVQRILSDPEFIFRTEAEPVNVKPGQTYRLSDLELASRLSFFLWSAPPDDELITLARQNKLRDPKVLEAQTRRLLNDPRSHELVTNFAGQWLQLRNLASQAPITQSFPDFDDNLRQSFRTETEMFFESVMREDRNVTDLLTGDWTFVNERLARHYGIPNIYGPQFRRITLGATLDVRRGLLGKGAILLVTALADRTSPVQRGKWVLMNILGTIPPDPPPNVPPLKESGKTANGQPVPLEVSMRDRMEEHRANPACASCHRMMDPIGFSLENFDAIGQWRNEQFGKKLDVRGELVDGSKFEGPLGLRSTLLKYSPQFTRMMTEKLMVYALGRGVEYYDMPVVRQIVRDASRNNYKFSSLILGIVKSNPFQMSQKSPVTTAELLKEAK